MAWFKFDDGAVDHPKLAKISDRAFRWWVRSLSYCSRYLTDGILEKTFYKQVPNAVRTELLNARLWDWIDPYFSIHDYHHHQSSKAEVEADKARNRKKAAEYRAKRRATADGVTGNVTGDVTGDEPGTLPGRRGGDVTTQITDIDTDTHTHTDVPKEPVPRASRSVEGFEEWYRAYPKKVAKGAALKAWTKINPSTEVRTQMLDALAWQRTQPQWLKDGGAYVPNPATYLNAAQWQDEPFFTAPEPVRVSAVQSRHERMLADIDAGVYGRGN